MMKKWENVEVTELGRTMILDSGSNTFVGRGESIKESGKLECHTSGVLMSSSLWDLVIYSLPAEFQLSARKIGRVDTLPLAVLSLPKVSVVSKCWTGWKNRSPILIWIYRNVQNSQFYRGRK